MSFEKITSEYLKYLKQACNNAEISGGYTPELSYKPILDGYFRNIAKLISNNIEVIFEPAKQGDSGRPDWRFYAQTSLGNYGYIEGKGLSLTETLSVIPYKNQIEKYLKLRSNLILTDGIEFCFFGTGFGDIKRLSIWKKGTGNLFKFPTSTIITDLELAFREFFKTPGYRSCSENELIQESAKRAKTLAEISSKLADIPPNSGLSMAENNSVAALRQLRDLLLKHHDPALQNCDLFADFVSQVLVFGLLYAHRFIASPDDTPIERMNKMKQFWEQPLGEGGMELLPFRELISNLNRNFTSDSDSIGPLQSWYDDCCRCLAHSKLKKSGGPDFHTLYESFLKAYDPKKKIDFGAFYTNPVLADMMVEMSEYLARHVMGLNSIFAEENNVIDPCCGTGTFIESIVKSTINGTPVNISGFEIQPAPYALANYRIALLKENHEICHNIKIVLTNTLSDKLEEKISAPCDLFDQEQLFAKELVRSPLILVIGNPPSSDSQKQHSAGNGFKIIQQLVNDFRPPQMKRHGRQNTQKQLQNDFMKFMRWACEKVLLNDNGILAFVIPSSFFENPTYEYARKWMAKRFNKIWVLKFDEDNRKGGAAKNIFKTLQGRSIIFAIRGKKLKSKTCEFFFKDISTLNVEQKMQFCKQEPAKLISEFAAVKPNNSITLGIGGSASDNVIEQYAKCWLLYPTDEASDRSIFLRHCSGIKLAPTALFVHDNPNVLQRRCREIGNLQESTSRLISRWFSGQRKPIRSEKLSHSVRIAFEKEVRLAHFPDKIFPYSFRPFLSSFVLLNENLLNTVKNEGGGGTRMRPEVKDSYAIADNIGFAVAPAPKDIGVTLHRFVSFCWHMPDNDLCSRGNAHVFCAQYPDYKSAKKKDNAPFCNASKSAMELDLSERDWVFYSFAIMSSQWYISRFAEMLYTASDNIPRIPIHKNLKTREKIVQWGIQIASLENSELHDFSVEQNFANNVKLFADEFQFVKFKIDDEIIKLFCSKSNQPVLNISGFGEDVLSLKVGGYDVVSTWLKFKTYAYTRMCFGLADFKELLSLLCAIERQFEILNELDDYLSVHYADPNNWI